MALPDGCHLEGNELVFYELANEATLADHDALYEHTCFVACTNALRPNGDTVVARFEYPVLTPEESLDWGGRFLTGELIDGYRSQGYVLCQLRLPVQPMGGPLPDGALALRRPQEHPPVD
jgi:hypothetical protein